LNNSQISAKNNKSQRNLKNSQFSQLDNFSERNLKGYQLSNENLDKKKH
jgi:uncharacterized protein YjbI with pentapeptide repeats